MIDEEKVIVTKKDNNKYSYVVGSISYILELKLSTEAISIKAQKQISTSFYEGIFPLKEMQGFKYLPESIGDIFNAIITKIEKGKIFLNQESDHLQFIIYFSIDDEVLSFTLNLPRASKEIDLSRAVENLFDEVSRINERLKTIENKLFPKLMKLSSIVTEDEEDMVKKWINIDSKKVTFQLLYKSSIDGNRASNFHTKCDGNGATISFIESSNGLKFGGYTTTNWDQSNTYKNDKNAFIFSLNKKRMFLCSNPINAIYCGSAYHITFGGGHDIYLVDSLNASSYSNFKHSYGKNDTIEGDSKSYLAGSYNFTPKEVEVYKVIIS